MQEKCLLGFRRFRNLSKTHLRAKVLSSLGLGWTQIEFDIGVALDHMHLQSLVLDDGVIFLRIRGFDIERDSRRSQACVG